MLHLAHPHLAVIEREDRREAYRRRDTPDWLTEATEGRRARDKAFIHRKAQQTAEARARQQWSPRHDAIKRPRPLHRLMT
jgi:hypothetical protein